MNSASPAPEPSGTHEPIWIDTTARTDYEPLADGLDVDVAVVGGGIAGVTTAVKLDERGRSVALIERDRILDGVTGHTTAKLTSLHGLVYDYLLDRVGEERARQYADANEAAIDDVEATVEERGIDCDFRRTPAYTYAPADGDRSKRRDRRRQIRDEVEAARRLGLPASFTEETTLPYDVDAAVKFEDQARFNPRRYLLDLARTVPGDGSRVFEETTVEHVSGGSPCTVETDGGTVTADHVVVATHFPVADHGFYYARMRPKHSYVVAARLRNDPPEGLYYKPYEPYVSVRPRPAGEDDLVLVGGQNHRTGHGHDTTERYEKLERAARERFDVEGIEYRWSTQDYVSVDRVPFVGPLAPQVRNVFVATGFGGWGMTNGTAAGILLADLITDGDAPWEDVYHPTRFRIGASLGDLVSHNRHALSHFVGDRISERPQVDLAAVDRGDGRVFDQLDEPVAVHRDDDGEIHAVSAVCTHMGCLVSWNDGERSWDCACHGSRFDVDGRVLDTPAVDDLEAVDVGDAGTDRRPGQPRPDVPRRPGTRSGDGEGRPRE